MKKTITIIRRVSVTALLTAVAFSLSSCAAGPYAKQGTVGGGLVGAAAGGIIGHQSGRGLEGAAVGGALGALAGALFGSAQDDVSGTAPQRGYGPPRPPGPPRRPGSRYDDRRYDDRQSYDDRRYDDRQSYDDRYDDRPPQGGRYIY